ncbi:hypothetical protein EHI8A_187890 [Entamoeba histolytica HM-1:IMSS-B]|uniref:TLDc domain-containing protein n=4 Tax=Entamoeba histolytica TaxID=5759 RepID=M3UVK1_ENTH1|nr:Hypothetical protein EHI5A_212000 [Entamoeba histolytica KU27]EMH75502.1 hypothetical protein EHI8A_187890 [Entamoeba histolytica HM-1:IMSS-B]EMS11124.1 hypothetical protein KM1_259240 [Entamoeba histolytica HM-3:IMSS]ENY60080.1 hypothetical protein EHI7A_164770 [Entamoeba histolytica HM-1:IMSS-A]
MLVNSKLWTEFTNSVNIMAESKTKRSFELLISVLSEALTIKNLVQYSGIGNSFAAIDFMEKHVLSEKAETELVNAFEITPELLDQSKKLGQIVSNDDTTNVNKIIAMSDEKFEFIVDYFRGDPIYEFVLTAFNEGKLSVKKSNLLKRKLHLAKDQSDVVLGCGYNLTRTQTTELVNRMLKTSEKRLSEKIIVVRKERERVTAFLEKDQIDKVEEWTNLKVGTIIFDSNVDDWSKGSSVFGQRVLNRKNLVFVIKDTKNNVFGGYVNCLIDRACLTDDTESFVFSLQSNGRIKTMMKFPIKSERKRDAFRLGGDDWDWLFWMGFRDIFIWKKGSEYENFCEQQSFEYYGITKALCGNSNFLVSRIIVIQMI